MPGLGVIAPCLVNYLGFEGNGKVGILYDILIPFLGIRKGS